MISKDAILNACEKLILANEPKVSLRKIASQIGCAPPSIYYYFKNKTEILQALWDRVLENAQQHISRSYSEIEAYNLYIQFWLNRPLEFTTFVMEKEHAINFSLSPDYDLILSRLHKDVNQAEAIIAIAHGVIIYILHQNLDETKKQSIIKQSSLLITHQ
ncbi:TetR/AcrR family transcriptional regulator [Marinicellulosiphila megalodicopiae]|uniref:TetR/AcrR family transcriptional regulator n=1 Tax=Marinicellulosiphila megalodicopiae TaxID=2724896 RepID=UPI003BB08567